jgi:hypothetical protein
MITFYTIIEVTILLAVIVLPLSGPRKKQKKLIKGTDKGLSNISVNENGYLEYSSNTPDDHHLV